jgi:Ca2+-binding EF-hand superfamily protein
MEDQVIVPALNKQEVDELYELFDKFDTDSSGELTLDELIKMVNNLGNTFILQYLPSAKMKHSTFQRYPGYFN